jgi:membrane-bound inhibitor of C-type lysozyme
MTRPALAAALATAFAMLAGPAVAQTAPAKPAAKPVKVAKAAPAAAVVAAPVVLAAAGAEQIEAAERTHYGAYACEFGQTVDVSISPRGSGYVDVKYKNSLFTMKPVVSSTGALRLEDVTGRTLMLQIANKSMLMDTKLGQRLVDECIHPEQAKFNAARAN